MGCTLLWTSESSGEPWPPSLPLGLYMVEGREAEVGAGQMPQRVVLMQTTSPGWRASGCRGPRDVLEEKVGTAEEGREPCASCVVRMLAWDTSPLVAIVVFVIFDGCDMLENVLDVNGKCSNGQFGDTMMEDLWERSRLDIAVSKTVLVGITRSTIWAADAVYPMKYLLSHKGKANGR